MGDQPDARRNTLPTVSGAAARVEVVQTALASCHLETLGDTLPESLKPEATAQNTGRKRPNLRLGLYFTPVRNGMDYLAKAVDDLTECTPPSARSLKYAVLHLQAATEVLLKARLVGEHWSLVYDDPRVASLKEFQKGNFKSCGIEATMDRLTEIAAVNIAPADRVAINNLASDRNALTHYGHTADAFLIEARTARVLSFLITFIENQLRPMLEAKFQEAFRNASEESFRVTPANVYKVLESPEVAHAQRETNEVINTMGDLRLKLGRVEKLVDSRMKEISGELAPWKHCTVLCPHCLQWALVVNSDGSFNPIKCHFCLTVYNNVELAAIDYAMHVVGEENGTVVECSKCQCETVVIGANIANDKDSDIAVCFNCADIYTHSHPSSAE
ncbi:hypothetical protein [Streptomyces griseoluteus]|uniref:hypothetical protein n=1 Tax=Streptomyces griseoluteus TaxID=29306 RepID=UPI0036F8548E